MQKNGGHIFLELIIPNYMPRKPKETKKAEEAKNDDNRDIVLRALGLTSKESSKEKPKPDFVPTAETKKIVAVPEGKEETPVAKKETIEEKKKLTPQVGKKKPKKAKKEHFWRKTIPFFVVIIILLIVVFLQSGLYFSSQLHTSATWLAKKIHYPVAVLGTHVITYDDLESERDVLLAYTQKGIAFDDNTLSVDAFALNKIIRSTMVEKAKKKFSSSLSDAAVEQAFVNLFGAQSDSRDAQVVSELILGLTADEIKEDIIRPYLEKAALTERLLKDPALMQQQKTIAEKIQIQVSGTPTSFSDEKTYASDTVKWYDLGYLPTSAFTGTFASVADLPVDGVSQLKEDETSYSIYKVTERLPSSENKPSEYIKVEKIEIQKITADLWVDAELRTSRIAVFDPSLSWNSACLQVTSQGLCYRSSSSTQTVTLDELYNALTGNSSIFAPSFAPQ